MQQSVRKVHDQSADFEPMSQYLQQHRLHQQQRKAIATKRKQSTDAEDDCQKQQQQQQQSLQHDDDQLSQSSCCSLAPISPPLRKLKSEVCTKHLFSIELNIAWLWFFFFAASSYCRNAFTQCT